MKKILSAVILSLVITVLVGCNQTSKEQSETNNQNTQQVMENK